MTRAEAINVLRTESVEIGGNAVSVCRFWEALDMAISALRQQEHPQWISVKDRLPETGGYVVCIAKRNPFSRFMPMVARIEKNGWVNPITEQYISEVTHWMPLPEPPEEGTR